MSLTPIGEPRRKITVSSLRDKKLHHEPITCLTAYDYSSARLVDEAGIDIVLVGDSLAMTMLGYENTLSVTVDEMLHHTSAVRRGVKHALLVADMPFGSYHVDPAEAVRNAARFVKEGGGGSGEDRRRRKACRSDSPHHRRRNSRRRTHRPDAAVGQSHGRLQGARQEPERREAAHARCGCAGSRRRGAAWFSKASRARSRP